MRKITVYVSLSLDGVMQAPGRADEDTRGGFEHGGWALPYADHSAGGPEGESVLLLGRRTYENFYSVWPHRTDNPFSELLNNMQKYVVSRTLTEPLPWMNSTLLTDFPSAVVALKEQAGPDIVVLGSGELVRSLAREDLIDVYSLTIHPLVLGSGRRLFPEAGPYAALRLVDSKPTATGVISATYERS